MEVEKEQKTNQAVVLEDDDDDFEDFGMEDWDENDF